MTSWARLSTGSRIWPTRGACGRITTRTCPPSSKARPKWRKIFDLTAIDFCPDTAHLAAAGGDPAQLIRDLASRISYVHLKGFQREPFAFTPLDRGDVPTGPILDAMRRTGFDGWVCVELDAWPDPAEGARLSMDFLNRGPDRPPILQGRRLP
jgi:hypothetical protein